MSAVCCFHSSLTSKNRETVINQLWRSWSFKCFCMSNIYKSRANQCSCGKCFLFVCLISLWKMCDSFSDSALCQAQHSTQHLIRHWNITGFFSADYTLISHVLWKCHWGEHLSPNDIAHFTGSTNFRNTESRHLASRRQLLETSQSLRQLWKPHHIARVCAHPTWGNNSTSLLHGVFTWRDTPPIDSNVWMFPTMRRFIQMEKQREGWVLGS